jgi:CubicO group peptidase (beta-lactamase class C family)
MNQQEKHFLEQLKTMPSGVTPGFVMQVYKNGKLSLDVEWGRIWKYYDLASLTKIIFTLPWIMKAYEEKKIDITRPLRDYLKWYPYDATILSVLTHTAGHDWWQPFYKKIDETADREEKKIQLRQMLIAQAPSKNVTKAIYSDIDFLLLGFLLEEIFQKEWSALAEELFAELKVDEIFFHEENKPRFKKNSYAPTEECSHRKMILQGQVHDENTFALGGVAPHAGLFGTVKGVAQWGLAMRNIGLGKSKWLKAATLKKFTSRAIAAEHGDWGLGFVIPTPGGSSSGSYFSEQSFGHTGFTGTSFWMDPENDLFVIILSNRIHPHRNNEEFKKWRPRLHDWAVESLKK